MYRALSDDELDYIHQCYKKRATAKDVADHMLDIIDQTAQKQERPVIEVFNELEVGRNRFTPKEIVPDKFLEAGGRLIDREEYLNSLPEDEREVQEFIMNAGGKRCRVISGYEYIFGEDETPFIHQRRVRIKFKNSQAFRDEYMSEKGFPTGLTLEQSREFLYNNAKQKNLVD